MLQTEIREKFNQARKEQNKELKATYEMVISKMIYEEKSGKYEKGAGLTDDVVQNIIIKIIKELKETQSFYKIENPKYSELENQIKELSQYLPKEMSENEVISIIKNIISSGESNVGKVTGLTIKQVGNSFDKSKISGLVKKVIND